MDGKTNDMATPLISSLPQQGIAGNEQIDISEYNMSEMIAIGKFLAQLITAKIPIAQKLCSKKLWLAVAGVLFGFIGQFTSKETSATLLNAGLQIVSILVYIISEATVDKARAVQNTATVELLDTMTTAIAGQKQEPQPPEG